MLTLLLFNRGPHLTTFRGVVDVRWHGEPHPVAWQHDDFAVPTGPDPRGVAVEE